MPGFEISTRLNVSLVSLTNDLLTMKGVNYELMPLIKMTAPFDWVEKPLYDWPIASPVFTSTLMLFGFLPVDRHKFKLLSTGANGFSECSSSISNHEWRHTRFISEEGCSCIVKDTVSFEPKLTWSGRIMLPIYKRVFEHRHKRLKAKYG